MNQYENITKLIQISIIEKYDKRLEEKKDEALKELILNYIQELGKTEIQINNEDYLVDKGKVTLYNEIEN